QLVVNQRQQLLCGARVAVLDGRQDLRDVRHAQKHTARLRRSQQAGGRGLDRLAGRQQGAASNHRAQQVSQDGLADTTALMGNALRVETEMNSAVDAGIIDVVRDLIPRGVVELDSRKRGSGEGDSMAVLTKGPL